MTKGIIVIDIPENCFECPCYEDGYIDDCYCRVTGESIYGYAIQLDCPIKPIPEKKYWKDKNARELNYRLGWNHCLKEILGE